MFVIGWCLRCKKVVPVRLKYWSGGLAIGVCRDCEALEGGSS